MSHPSIDPRRLEPLLEIGRGLVAHHNSDSVLDEVLAAARELTGARYAALGVLDEDGRWLARFLAAGIDDEVRRKIGPPPRGHGILGELIRDPRPLRLREIADHPHSYGFPYGHPQMSTFLGVPVTIRDQVFGNLYLTEKAGGRAFDAGDEHVLVVLAEWAAIAIDNAREHETGEDRRLELERAVGRLEATVALGREIGGETDIGRVLELVAKRARALVDGQWSVVYLLDRDDLRVAEVAGEVGRGDVGDVLMAGSPAWDALRSRRSQILDPPELTRAGISAVAGSALVAPLRSRGRDLGILVVFREEGSQAPFSADDILGVDSFVTSASTAIRAARSIEDERMRLSIASSERERQRWARELHDETLQELGALNVMLESALQVDDADAAREALARSNEQLQGVIAGLHGLITELRPAALDDLGVAAALDALVERVRTRTGLDVDLDVDLSGGRPDDRRPPVEVEAAVYRIVQEALNNVVKHAGASRARVLVERRRAEIAITVEDDGAGIGDHDSGDGYGLVGMRERTALLGGSLVVDAAEGGGTRVSARLPIGADGAS